MNNQNKEEHIGSGAFADVYKVITPDNKVRARKKFKPEVDQTFIKNEITNLCKLQSSFVVHAFGCENPNLQTNSIFMEVYPTDLEKAIKQGITPFRAFRLFTEILKGIDFIHKRHMVHNDLKPQNIFLDHKDSIKIGDFGLSRHCNLPQCHGLIQGTPIYLPPEALKFGLYSPKTDIYAIGIITFEMFAKLNENNYPKVILQLREDPKKVTYDKLSSVNILPMKYEIIPQLLAQHPQQRPNADDLLAQLKEGNSCPQTPQKQANAPAWGLGFGFALALFVVLLVFILYYIFVIKGTNRYNKYDNSYKLSEIKMFC